jgi:CheY-like chemotaxis protein
LSASPEILRARNGRRSTGVLIIDIGEITAGIRHFGVRRNRISDASLVLLISYVAMDVLIVERDELMGSMLADTLGEDGISAAVTSDDKALTLPDVPQVVVTGINRGHTEDLKGLQVVSAMRRKWPQLCVVYLAALWPARLRHEMLSARERFLTKPVGAAQLTRTVRELLTSGLCSQARWRHGLSAGVASRRPPDRLGASRPRIERCRNQSTGGSRAGKPWPIPDEDAGPDTSGLPLFDWAEAPISISGGTAGKEDSS